MKFLKLRYIIAYIIILIVGILALLYYTGGLKFRSLENDNIVFDSSDFVDFSTGQKDENGNPIVLTYNKNKVIAEVDDHVLLFNEETTVAKIIDKRTCSPAGDYSNCKVVYQTATDDTKSSSGANVILNYAAKSNGIASNIPFDSMTGSVKFENKLTGQIESHYQLKYIDNGVQILYDIGKHSANDDYFPKYFNSARYNIMYSSATDMTDEELAELEYFNMHTIEERFRGNVLFATSLSEVRTKDTDEGTVKYKVISYTGSASVYSLDAVNYIRENDLATVLTEDPDGIKNGYWQITDIDESFYNSYGTHLNSDSSPCTSNPFFSTQMYSSLSTSYYNRQKSQENASIWVYGFNMSTTSEKAQAYRFLYTSFQQTDINNSSVLIFDEDDNPVIRGGFHGRDHDGHFLYDEDGKPIQELYTLELASDDNALFGIESASSLQRFQVCLQLVLTEDGLDATIIADSLRDSDHKKLDPIYDHDSIMTSIQFLRQITTASETYKEKPDDEATYLREGMIVIPDGAGAIINFNNGKSSYAGYSKKVYGDDKAFISDRAIESGENLMFGMFGFIDLTDKKGIMTVVEKGAPRSVLTADVPRGSIATNRAYYTTNVRENEYVTAGTGWNAVKFPKWSKVLSPSDITYRFIFLEQDELSYVALANRYREYLINKYALTVKDETNENVTTINFLGAFERYAMTLGIKYMKADNLTTFAQAQEIVAELLENDITNLQVSYSAWTNKEMEYETTSKLKASKVLGGKKGLKSLAAYLSANNIPFYPEIYVGSSKGYDYTFGNIKYTTRSVGNIQAVQYPFNLATLYVDKKLTPTHYLRPSVYDSVSKKLISSYGKFNIDGVYLSDLGNMKIGDYTKGREVFTDDGIRYQRDALALYQDNNYSLLLSAPYDFAFEYVDSAINAPVRTSAYGIFDNSIPFYQLVASGLFDYSTPLLNSINDQDSKDSFYAKALETGSNLYFQLSYENPSVLLETDYTQYFAVYYKNLKEDIIYYNNKINASGIHGGRLIDHQTIAKDVSKVSYSNGVVLVVNKGKHPYTYNGQVISGYDYISIGG